MKRTASRAIAALSMFGIISTSVPMSRYCFTVTMSSEPSRATVTAGPAASAVSCACTWGTVVGPCSTSMMKKPKPEPASASAVGAVGKHKNKPKCVSPLRKDALKSLPRAVIRRASPSTRPMGFPKRSIMTSSMATVSGATQPPPRMQ